MHGATARQQKGTEYEANAFSPQFPAATCAANGVDFLEPLKPEPPEVAQQTALP
jgi:hypothetical protein